MVRKKYVAQTCRQVVIFLILIKLFLDLKGIQGSLNLILDELYGSSLIGVDLNQSLLLVAFNTGPFALAGRTTDATFLKYE